MPSSCPTAVTDTIKEHRGEGRLRSLDRRRLWAMETPQVFSRDLITRAYARVAAKKLRITDDASAVELLKHPVALLENSYPNPKPSRRRSTCRTWNFCAHPNQRLKGPLLRTLKRPVSPL